MKRRDMMKALLALSATGALAACGQKASKGEGARDLQKYASLGNFLDGQEIAFLTTMSGILIPATDTAGAADVGVPNTLQTLLSEWATDDMRVGWRTAITDLGVKLSELAGGSFAEADAEAQVKAVTELDAMAFDGGDDALEPYKQMKSLIGTAYFMSEPGASEQLAYEAVPGEWKGCVPLSDYPKAWAT